MAKIKLGVEGAIYLGSVGSETEVTNVKDVTLTLETGEHDRTTRGSKGWREIYPTLRECTVEFELVPSVEEVDAEEYTFDLLTQTVLDAFLSGATINAIVLSEQKRDGAEGLAGKFSVTSFPLNQPLEAGQTFNVTLKLTEFTAWLILEVLQREQNVYTGLYSLLDGNLTGTFEVTCPITNAGIVYFRGDDDSDVPWQPGESHTFNNVSTSNIRMKGTLGDKVMVRSTSWQEAC